METLVLDRLSGGASVLSALDQEGWDEALAILSSGANRSERAWRLWLAEAFLFAGRCDKAKVIYQALTDENPDDEPAYAGLLFATYWETFPNHGNSDTFQALMALCSSIFSGASWLEAMILFAEKAPSSSKGPVDFSLDAAHLDAMPEVAGVGKPTSGSALHRWLLYGDALYWSGQTEAARIGYRAALTRFPAATPLLRRLAFWFPERLPVDAVVAASEASRLAKRMTASLMLSKLCCMTRPNHLRFLDVYIKQCNRACLFKEMARYARYALSLADTAKFSIYLGQAYFYLRRYGEARAVFEASVERWPEHVSARIGLLWLELKDRRYEEAGRLVDRIHQVNRLAARSKAASMPEEHLKNISEFLRITSDLKEVLKKGPPADSDELIHWVNYGDALVFDGRPEEGISAYREALKRYPDLLALHQRLIFLEEKKYDKIFSARTDPTRFSKTIFSQCWLSDFLQETREKSRRLEQNFKPTLLLSNLFSGCQYVAKVLQAVGGVFHRKHLITCHIDRMLPVPRGPCPKGLFLTGHILYPRDGYVENKTFLSLVQDVDLQRYHIFRHPIDVRLSSWFRRFGRAYDWETLFDQYFDVLKEELFYGSMRFLDQFLYFSNPAFKQLRFEDIHSDPKQFFVNLLTDIDADFLIPRLEGVVEPPRTPAFLYRRFLHIPKFRALLENLPGGYVDDYLKTLGYDLDFS